MLPTVLFILTAFFNFVLMIHFSLTLTKTLLVNKRYSNLLSTGIFFFLVYFIEKVYYGPFLSQIKNISIEIKTEEIKFDDILLHSFPILHPKTRLEDLDGYNEINNPIPYKTKCAVDALTYYYNIKKLRLMNHYRIHILSQMVILK